MLEMSSVPLDVEHTEPSHSDKNTNDNDKSATHSQTLSRSEGNPPPANAVAAAGGGGGATSDWNEITCADLLCSVLLLGGIAVGFAFAVRHEVMRRNELAQTLCDREFTANPFQIGLVGGARQRIVWNLGHLETNSNGTTAFVAKRQCTTYDVPPPPGAVSRFMYGNQADGCCFAPETPDHRGWEAFGLLLLAFIVLGFVVQCLGFCFHVFGCWSRRTA